MKIVYVVLSLYLGLFEGYVVLTFMFGGKSIIWYNYIRVPCKNEIKSILNLGLIDISIDIRRESSWLFGIFHVRAIVKSGLSASSFVVSVYLVRVSVRWWCSTAPGATRLPFLNQPRLGPFNAPVIASGSQPNRVDAKHYIVDTLQLCTKIMQCSSLTAQQFINMSLLLLPFHDILNTLTTL